MNNDYYMSSFYLYMNILFSLKRVEPSRVLELILTVFGGTGRGSAWSAYVHKTQYPMYVYRLATSIMDVVNPT